MGFGTEGNLHHVSSLSTILCMNVVYLCKSMCSQRLPSDPDEEQQRSNVREAVASPADFHPSL